MGRHVEMSLLTELERILTPTSINISLRWSEKV
jgi:hypothetical protein